MLEDEYGVTPESVTFLTGGEEEPGRPEKLALDLPPEIRVEAIGPEQTLSAMTRDRVSLCSSSARKTLMRSIMLRH